MSWPVAVSLKGLTGATGPTGVSGTNATALPDILMLGGM